MSKILSFDHKYKHLIKFYTKDELEEIEIVKIDEKLNKNDLKYFKLFNKHVKIIFQHDDYLNILNCIKYIENDIIIKVSNKEEFNKILLKYKTNNINLNNINIIIKKDVLHIENEISLKEYLECENKLYKMIKPAIKLSPLEKYVYVYNLVKKFKEYKECKTDSMESRDLYKVLKNDYIVCVGYIKLLCDLLRKLGINCSEVSIKVDSSYDFGTLEEVKSVDKQGHRRAYVYIKDDKYKIDGYYLTDPTWDNNMNMDYYTHMLFTDNKNDFSCDYQWLDKYILFNVKNKHEFNKYFDLSNKILGFNSYYCNYRFYIMDFLLDVIKDIEPDYALYLKNKYKCIKKTYIVDKISPNYEEMLSLKDEIGEHIVKRVNNDIDEKILWEVIRKIYKKFYGYKNKLRLDCRIELLKIYNEENEKKYFLKRTLER